MSHLGDARRATKRRGLLLSTNWLEFAEDDIQGGERLRHDPIVNRERQSASCGAKRL
jgi:hypothetical protein